MKASEHKTTMRDVMLFLLDGPKLAEVIGEHFWPDKVGFGPPRGGPPSVAVSAAYLLGRMRVRGYVDKRLDQRESNYAKWFLTDRGHQYLRETATD